MFNFCLETFKIINHIRLILRLISLILLVILFVFPADLKSNENKTQIYVVNYPLQYFTERIAGDLVDVHFPAPTNIDPAFWVPSREVIKEYQNADLIIVNGAGYAKWLNIVSLPGSKIVNTSESFRDKYIKITVTSTHSHGPAGEHSHTGYAFTTWLDPILAIKQAEAIKISLEKLNPENKNTFSSNFDNLKNDLLEIDKQLSAIFALDSSKPLLASHPVYQYLKERYGLNIRSLHMEPDEYPDKSQFAEIENMLKDAAFHWILWENNPLKKTETALKQMGINSIVFNPCGNVPESGNYLSVMQLNIENLKNAYN